MELAVLNQAGETVGSVKIKESIFARAYNKDLVQQIVVRHQANIRGGSRAQKTRSEVAYSTRKPWKQKGTGRARSGMKSSPIWRGGGRAFPSSVNEVFSKKINKKMYKAGMSCIYSELLRSGRLTILDSLQVSSPKTKEFVQVLSVLKVDNVLFCLETPSQNIVLSSRNLVNVKVLSVSEMNPVVLIKQHNTFITQEALLMIEEDLSC